MNMVLAALDGAWKVLLAGLLLGAGLPVLFALAVRSLSWGAADVVSADGTTVARAAANPWGKVAAGLLFAVVLAAIALGITYIVAHGFGYSLGFNGILPTLSKK